MEEIRLVVNEKFSSFKLIGYKGKVTTFDEDDIEEFLAEPKMYSKADNLPKWLRAGIYAEMKTVSPVMDKLVSKVLKKIKSGKIKVIKIKYDNQNNIVGLDKPHWK